MSWPPPLAARWTALALFLFALALHLFVAMGGALLGMDFKLLIILDELGAILLAPVLFTILLGVGFRSAFALRSTHWGHYAIAGATAIPLQIFGGAVQELVLETIPGGEQWRELLEAALEPLLGGQTTMDIVLLLFGAVVLAAVCEEVLFRGVLMQLLAQGNRWWFGIIVSAVLFAVFHLDFIGLIPRTLLGIYFGVLVWRSGSIFPAMLAHGANNLLAFALAPYADPNAGPPSVMQALLIAAVSGGVFLVLMIAYLRMTKPQLDSGGSLASARSASEEREPTDTLPPPDSSPHKDPRES